MSGKSIELDRWLTDAGEAGQSGGKGWVRLSSRGVQEGQEVDPAQPPAQVHNAADADVHPEGAAA